MLIIEAVIAIILVINVSHRYYFIRERTSLFVRTNRDNESMNRNGKRPVEVDEKSAAGILKADLRRQHGCIWVGILP